MSHNPYETRDLLRKEMPFDPVKRAKGYNSHPSGVETVQVTEHMTTMLGTAVKYVWRRGAKGALVQDLEKALWCFEREHERIRLPGSVTLWDGSGWRAHALDVALADGGTVLGQCMKALLLCPHSIGLVEALDRCIEATKTELLRLEDPAYLAKEKALREPLVVTKAVRE